MTYDTTLALAQTQAGFIVQPRIVQRLLREYRARLAGLI